MPDSEIAVPALAKRRMFQAYHDDFLIDAEPDIMRIVKESLIYNQTSIDEWPDFDIQWDLDGGRQHLALDGCSPEDIKEDFPNGLILIENVPIEQLDKALVTISRQTPDEFWDVGTAERKARIISMWRNGRRLTPPIVILWEEGIFILGGNHRLAVARAKGVQVVPLYVNFDEDQAIRKLLDLELGK